MRAGSLLLAADGPVGNFGILSSGFGALKISAPDPSQWPSTERSFDLVALQPYAYADSTTLGTALQAAQTRLTPGGRIAIIAGESSAVHAVDVDNWSAAMQGLEFSGIDSLGGQVCVLLAINPDSDGQQAAAAVRGALDALKAVDANGPTQALATPAKSTGALSLTNLLPTVNQASVNGSENSASAVARVERLARKAKNKGRSVSRKTLLAVALIALVLSVLVVVGLLVRFGWQALVPLALVALAGIGIGWVVLQDRWNRRFNNRLRDVVASMNQAHDALELTASELASAHRELDARTVAMSTYLGDMLIQQNQSRER